MSVAALEARGLVRDFGPVRAVDGVDFRLEAGSLLAVFGPNGAGKTSLLRMLAGGLTPTAGEVRIHGQALSRGDPAWRARVGVLSHRTFLYGALTPRENLRFHGRLFGLEDLHRRIPERLEAVGLVGRADDPVRALSRGMRQRLALARTLLHDPEVVLLDEPWTGLDAHAASVLREVLATLKDGRRTVVLVTHNLVRGLELADRVAVQVRGRFLLERPATGLDPVTLEELYHGTVESAR